MAYKRSKAAQERRVHMAEARVSIDNAWAAHDLTTLEMIEVLSGALYSISSRHRAATEPDQPDEKTTEIVL